MDNTPRFRFRFGPLLAGCALAVAGAAALAQADEPLQPLPEQKFDLRKVALGERLFSDKRFSTDGTVACISCHSFQHGGADPRPRSIGARGAVGAVNSPSIFNSGLNFRQLWNGAVTTPEGVIDRVVKSPTVFNSSWAEVLGKLTQDGALVRDFAGAYPSGLTAASVMNAIATYQRSLVTPSRFDAWLLGDKGAITADEKKGYDNFKKYGCVACHQGINVGGNVFQKFGAVGDYFKDRVARGQPMTDADKGYFNVTRLEDDMHVFKVPSLRNVALTAPYFHDASAATLEDAVDVMFKYQLGRTAPAADKALIVKFLHTLSGTLKAAQ
ncbi:MAG: c-type cytochrome [Burkholderiales bacterium]|nr:c-type cytochrome [Burkholderiales bacterium]